MTGRDDTQTSGLGGLTPKERDLLRAAISEAKRKQLGLTDEPAPEGTRRCCRCKCFKSLESFSLAPRKPLGRSYECKQCKADVNREGNRARKSAARPRGVSDVA